jgi:putative ABC transport system ATP-binding protein
VPLCIRYPHEAAPWSNGGMNPNPMSVRGLTKVYGAKARRVKALNAVSFDLHQGEFVAIMGASGSGKSTLLQCASGLDRPTEGHVMLGDVDLSTLTSSALAELRRSRIGFIFQSYNLLPALTAVQNVELPRRLEGGRPVRSEALEYLELVGVAGLADRRPGEMSGGQQQRVAIARAMATRPDVLFGDEPTGALDSVSSRNVLALFRRTVDELGQTTVMVTHDPAAAVFADRVFFLADGQITDIVTNPELDGLTTRLARLEATHSHHGGGAS